MRAAGGVGKRITYNRKKDYSSPFSLKLVYESLVTMTWSKTSMPSSLPASCSLLVTSKSSCEGSKLPLG